MASFLALLFTTAGCIRVEDSSSFHGHSASQFSAVTNVSAHGEIPSTMTRLEIQNRYGNIRVVSAEDGQTGWTWTLEVRARTEEVAQRVAAATTLAPEREENRLRFVLSMPELEERYSYRSELDLRVPKTSQLRCENRFGKVEVEGITGNMEINNQHGMVDLRDLPGRVNAQTTYASLTAARTGAAILKSQHGSITADQVQGDLTAETSYARLEVSNVQGEARVRNQHGALHLSRVSGSADARTSYAALDARAISGGAVLVNQHGRVEAAEMGGTVEAQTSYAPLEVISDGPSVVCVNQHGSIRIRARAPWLRKLTAQTSYGSLQVGLPAESSPFLYARTTYGEIDSEFPVNISSQTPEAPLHAPEGRAEVTLNNRHGDIRVSRN